MKAKVLVLMLLVAMVEGWAQSGQTSPAAATDPSQVPVTYNPQDAPAGPAYTPAATSTVNAPVVPGAIEMPAAVSTVSSPSMPGYVEAPTAPPSVSQPGLPANNYGPATPSGAARLTTPPMIGNGAPTPISNTLPATTETTSAPQPPTCDRVCY